MYECTNQPFVAVRGWRYVLADTHPNRCRPLRKYSRIITYHYISMPYGPNLTNKFAILHVCLYHVYVQAAHNCPSELYNIHGDTHATIKVTVQSVPSSTVRTKRTVREPEQSEKMPFEYKSRRISHSSPHFPITMKNGIHVDQRNQNDCSRHVASSMCRSSPWN